MLIKLSSAFAIEFNGTVTDESGGALNNSIINVTIRNIQTWNVIGYNFTVSNESGWFN